MPSTRDGRPSNRRPSGRPLGVTILCVIGAIGVFFGVIGSFGLIASGGPGPILGLVVLALTVGQGIALVGLWSLQYWGYKWSLVFYGLSLVLDLVTVDVLGVVISVLIVGYLVSKADHFR